MFYKQNVVLFYSFDHNQKLSFYFWYEFRENFQHTHQKGIIKENISFVNIKPLQEGNCESCHDIVPHFNLKNGL